VTEAFTFKPNSNFNYIQNEFLSDISDIHLFLINNPNLSNHDKLNLCDKQRHHIKLYLHQIIKRVDKNDSRI